ncbi:triacylglycerol lipase OBL1 isoform X2 [Magnolia sinica]|uniref:triacylglycerol lipase OBL1 isoform X2 n=1 Tax=Magnolia sinica TaxID=86752 RepID=UPI002658CB38|nr:triacylglycerol lipase OBL1 isoform X2 [Magnolia sinica]
MATAIPPLYESDGEPSKKCRYLIVWPHKGRTIDVLHFLLSPDGPRETSFLESSDELGPIPGDHRWVIVVSIIVRRIIAIFGKPTEWTGFLIEYLLNLLAENGDLLGLVYNILRGKVVMPHRNSETFISAIGHLDGRIDLYKGGSLSGLTGGIGDGTGNRALMDLCMMTSKLAYENALVVRNIVVHHWKMHFVEFYNGWNDFEKDYSTQVFILCDKPKDASLVLISFRGTEPFDADDWSTDFDYSWFEIPELGKVHMGFLEALGLGNRAEVTTFQELLQIGEDTSNGRKQPPQSAMASDSQSDSKDDEDGVLPEMAKMTAYYAVRSRLRILLNEHKNAKFIVTGHSLGGALAILFPAVLLLHKEKEMMKRLLGVYTFGQPRVGDRQLGSFMEAHLNVPVPRYYRLVYSNDLVPRLPYDDKTFLYKHFGLCLYYNSCYVEQNVDEEPNRNYFGLRYVIPDHLNAVWELIRSMTMGYTHGPEYKEGWFSIFLRTVGLAIPGLSAHSPTDYVNSVRLGRQRVQMSSI